MNRCWTVRTVPLPHWTKALSWQFHIYWTLTTRLQNTWNGVFEHPIAAFWSISSLEESPCLILSMISWDPQNQLSDWLILCCLAVLSSLGVHSVHRHLQTPADTCRHLQTPAITCNDLQTSVGWIQISKEKIFMHHTCILYISCKTM